LEEFCSAEDEKHFQEAELNGEDFSSDSEDDFVDDAVREEKSKDEQENGATPFVQLSREEQLEVLKEEIPEDVIKNAVNAYAKQKEEIDKLSLKFWNKYEKHEDNFTTTPSSLIHSKSYVCSSTAMSLNSNANFAIPSIQTVPVNSMNRPFDLKQFISSTPGVNLQVREIHYNLSINDDVHKNMQQQVKPGSSCKLLAIKDAPQAEQSKSEKPIFGLKEDNEQSTSVECTPKNEEIICISDSGSESDDSFTKLIEREKLKVLMAEKEAQMMKEKEI
jgi:hypothetical protein